MTYPRLNKIGFFAGKGGKVLFQNLTVSNIRTPEEGILAAHHVLLAHGKAVKVMREYAKQKINIGVACCGDLFFPDTEKEEDIEAARQLTFKTQDDPRGIGNRVSWFADPIYLGHYPEDGLRKHHLYLPSFAEKQIEQTYQPVDFCGQNMYQGNRVRMGENGPERVKLQVGHPMTACGWPITPECLYWGLKFLHERYKKDLFVTENGCSNLDLIFQDGCVHDPMRMEYLSRHLKELERARNEKIPVKGYFLWSLLDNFEWTSGYSQRFGIVYVDYKTQKRVLKDSAYWYREYILNY